jgi:hypothetical protein
MTLANLQESSGRKGIGPTSYLMIQDTSSLVVSRNLWGFEVRLLFSNLNDVLSRPSHSCVNLFSGVTPPASLRSLRVTSLSLVEITLLWRKIYYLEVTRSSTVPGRHSQLMWPLLRRELRGDRSSELRRLYQQQTSILHLTRAWMLRTELCHLDGCYHYCFYYHSWVLGCSKAWIFSIARNNLYICIWECLQHTA